MISTSLLLHLRDRKTSDPQMTFCLETSHAAMPEVEDEVNRPSQTLSEQTTSMGDTIMNFTKGVPWFFPNFTEYPDHFEGTCSDEQEVQEIIEWLQCSHGCDFVFW